jgi:hypothetical protein
MSEQLVSGGTLLTILIGLVISYFYLKHMWSALQKAVRTRDDADTGQDRFSRSMIGAIIAVIGSAAAITVYGAGPALLYAGPALALASAIAVAFCLREEALHD